MPRAVDDATLAAANNKLAALPLDHIPPIAPWPPGSRMPFSANPLFVGRQADLQTLAAALRKLRQRWAEILAADETGFAAELGGDIAELERTTRDLERQSRQPAAELARFYRH